MAEQPDVLVSILLPLGSALLSAGVMTGYIKASFNALKEQVRAQSDISEALLKRFEVLNEKFVALDKAVAIDGEKFERAETVLDEMEQRLERAARGVEYARSMLHAFQNYAAELDPVVGDKIKRRMEDKRREILGD